MDTRQELARLVLTSQQDLHRMWEILMNPLGFSRRSVWVVLVDRDGRPLPHVTEVAETAERLGDLDVDSFYATFGPLLLRMAPEGSLALLISRPGSGGLELADRVMARMFVAGARRADVALRPLHVAGDHRLLAVAPDDLAA